MQLSAVGIVVRDMRASLTFYRRCGLEFPAGADQEKHVETTLPGGLRLMFDTIEVVRSFMEWEEPRGGHRMGLAFDCGSREGVDETFAALVAEGVEPLKEPFDAFWGQRYAQVHDPDGNPVDLFH